MKYLFLFNGQPLLLCCVCCKIAIQDFVTGLHKKNKKNLRFHRRVHQRTITRRYFTESYKTFTRLCHNHRRHHQRTIPVGISQRVAKTFTGLCHNHRRVHRRIFRRTIPTDLRTSKSPRMSDTCPLHKYRWIDRCQIPTESPTDLRTSRSPRMSDTCPSAQIPMD